MLFLLLFDRKYSPTVDIGSTTMGFSINIFHTYSGAIPVFTKAVIRCSSALHQQTSQFDHRSLQSNRTSVVVVFVHPRRTKTSTTYACSCMTQLLPYLTGRTAHMFVHLQSAPHQILLESENPRQDLPLSHTETFDKALDSEKALSCADHPSKSYHSHSGTARTPSDVFLTYFKASVSLVMQDDMVSAESRACMCACGADAV
jgi:hypothetical protein